MTLLATIVVILNAVRGDHGLPALTSHPWLEAAAAVHNEVMFTSGCYGHACPGDPPWGSGARVHGFPASRYGEVVTSRDGPEAVVASWLTSRGHARAILDPTLTHIGCASATRPDPVRLRLIAGDAAGYPALVTRLQTCLLAEAFGPVRL